MCRIKHGKADMHTICRRLFTLVKNLENRRAVCGNIRRNHQNISNVRAVFQKLADLRMHRLYFANLRRSCGNRERFVILKNVTIRENVFAVRNHPLKLMQKRIARMVLFFFIKAFDVFIKAFLIIVGKAPKFNVVAACTPPVHQERIFIFRQIIFHIGIRIFFCRIRRSNIALYLRIFDIFPEFHARILDVGVHLVLLGKLLQNHAVELSHSRKSQNKDGLFGIVMEFHFTALTVHVVQKRQRKIFHLLIGIFCRSLKDFGQQGISIFIVENRRIKLAFPDFVFHRLSRFRKEEVP